MINLRHLDLSEGFHLEPVRVGKLSLLETFGKFVVGTEESGRSIKELHRLNHLEGSLEIVGLENVRDGEEGKHANLAAKKNLSSLRLHWGDGYGRRTNSSISNKSEEDVLEALQPPLNLSRSLIIIGYRGSRFPSWINNLVNLVQLKLCLCSKCEDLPPLGHLPLLKKLKIEGMDSLKRINKQFYGINSSREFFPSLEYLQFYKMPNWEEWEALDHKQVFPCLRELVLLKCPKLALLPPASLCSVQNFEVQNCQKLRSLPSMPCLRGLRVGSSSAFEKLTDLNPLSQTLQHLSSLQTLEISNCPQLKLSVGDFQHLLSLQCLKLVTLPKLTSLPDLHHLSTLQTLTILWCKNLMVLPQGMQNLTSLRTLKILCCNHDIHMRCKKDEGEYWPYISHISNLDITPTFQT